MKLTRLRVHGVYLIVEVNQIKSSWCLSYSWN